MDEQQQKAVGALFVAAGVYAFSIADGDNMGYILGTGSILLGIGMIGWWRYLPVKP